jgi:PIN domain nuclease of toxin-antitoxin system
VLDAVRGGQTIVVSYGRNRTKVAAMVPYAMRYPSHKRTFGLLKGKARKAIMDSAKQVFVSSVSLPKIEHEDPFDRMLVWQCLQNRWTFITRDRAMGEYRSLGLKTYG